MLVVDSDASRLALRTRSKGLLARLAHDLELRSEAISGRATLDGEVWTAELTIPVASLRVTGVLHGDELDSHGLGASDCADVERKVREEVFVGTRDVRATGTGHSRTAGSATVTLGRKTAPSSLTLSSVDERADGTFLVKGHGTVSLSALEVKDVKGPLGAFRVADSVEIRFELVLKPA